MLLAFALIAFVELMRLWSACMDGLRLAWMALRDPDD